MNDVQMLLIYPIKGALILFVTARVMAATRVQEAVRRLRIMQATTAILMAVTKNAYLIMVFAIFVTARVLAAIRGQVAVRRLKMMQVTCATTVAVPMVLLTIAVRL